MTIMDKLVLENQNNIADRYKIIEKKSGGMGIVYFCLDTKNDNFPVALKTIKSELLPDQKARQRFLREASLWIELGFHPNIVQAYRVAYISKNHDAYIELQLIPTPVGHPDASLRSFIKPNNPIPLEKTLEIGIGISRGMRYAVSKFQGLVHRDLKPENILIALDGNPLITDFGLVSAVLESNEINKALSNLGKSSLTQGIVGTPLYMSPEQFQGSEIKSSSDIYSLGCILYEMLTGNPAVTGFQIQHIAYSHISGVAISNLRNSNLPQTIIRLLEKFIHNSSEKRFQSWDQVESALVGVYQELFNKSAPIDEIPSYIGLYKDIQKAESYLAIGSSYLDLGKLGTAQEYYVKGLQIGNKINYIPVIASANANIGVAYSESGNFQKSIDYYKKAISLWLEIGNIAWAGRNMGNLGNAYFGLMDLENAQRYLEKALENFLEIGGKIDQAFCYGNLGNVYAAQGKYQLALTTFQKAIDIDRQAGDRFGEYKSLTSLGQTYQVTGNNDKAFESYQTALEIAKEVGDKKGQGTINLALGGYYAQNGQLLKAMSNTKEAYEISMDVGDLHLMAQCYGNLSLYLTMLGKYDEALPILEDTIKISKGIGARDISARANMTLGQIYLMNSESEKARRHIREAVEIFRELNLPEYSQALEILRMLG